MNVLAIVAVIAAIIGLAVAIGLASWIGKQEEGTDRMKEIAGYIREGAMAFLKREYKIMVIVIVVLFVLIGLFINWISAVLYVCGALLSVLAGFFGMKVATLGNVRTAAAAEPRTSGSQNHYLSQSAPETLPRHADRRLRPPRILRRLHLRLR